MRFRFITMRITLHGVVKPKLFLNKSKKSKTIKKNPSHHTTADLFLHIRPTMSMLNRDMSFQMLGPSRQS